MTTKAVKIVIDIAKGASFGAGLKAVEALTDGIGAVAGTAKELTVQSVKLAADFQTTTNAMTVFAGSARLANQELSAIAKSARDTPGLRLEAAEKGTAQMRALGFEAENARKLVVGLGKQKLLSPLADESAIQRVIVNLTQLSSGSNRASMDIKEIIHALPSMKKAFQDAFGSVDPDKIKSLFETDPDGTIKKLADAMARAEAPAGGLNDSIGKLSDSLIELGRLTGEPILDPLTTGFRNLTDSVHDNKNAFVSWGQYVGDTISGAQEILRRFNEEQERLRQEREKRSPSPASSPPLLQRALGLTDRDYRDMTSVQSAGLIGGFLVASQREGEQLRQTLAEQAKQFPSFSPSKLGKNNTFDLSNWGKLLQTPEQAEAERAREAAEAREERRREAAKAKSLNFLKIEADEAEKILKNRFSIEQAIRGTNLRYTAEQEIKYLIESGKSKNDFLQSEIARVSGFYDKQLALQDLTDEESKKLTAEKNKTLSDLNTQLKLNAVETFAEIQKQELRRYAERQQAAIDFKSLQIRENQSLFDKQAFDLERSIEKGNILAAVGFDKLKEITQSNLAEQLRLTRESYALQLKDKSLTDEQIVNLQKRRDLELFDLAEQNRREILRIEENLNNKRLQNTEEFIQRQVNAVQQGEQALNSAFQNFSGLGNPKSLLSSLDAYIGEDLRQHKELIGNQSKALLDEIAKSSLYYNAAQNLPTGKTDAELEAHKSKVSNLKSEWDKAKDLVRSYSQQIEASNLRSPQALFDLPDKIRGISSAKDFDRISSDLLKARQQSQRSSLELQFEEFSNLLKQNPGNKQITNKLTAVGGELQALSFEQADESAKHYSQTLEGLAENYRFLSSDESKFFIQHTAEKQIWSEKNALILENKILEQKYYQDAEYLALQRRNKLLQYERDIFELREELNQKSVFSATEAQAKILEHLNRNTKSKTDIFADSFISAFDKIASHADKMLDKSGIGKIPILGDIAKAQSRNMLSDFTRGTLGKIFPELSKQLEKTGNPQLDEAKTQTQILKSIDSKIGGGSSIFDTSTRPRIVQQAIGAVTGGGLFGGANSANPMIYHAGQPRGVMGDFRGQAAGLQEYLGGGGGSIIDRIKGIFGTGEGGLFAARKNLLTGKMSKGGGYGAGIGSLMSMAGGLVGGRWGNALSMAGQGAQFGAMFGGWGALIGGGIGGAIGLFKALRGGGDSKKKLKQAVQTAYGITVNDDSVLSQLESIGKAYFGGVAGNENKIIATDEARYIIESFASRSGQSLSKLNAGKITDENWSGNNFGLPFHGYSQATARTSVSSIINQRRPELTATMNFGSSAPGHSSTSSNALSEKIENALQMVADMCVVNTEMTQTFIETVKSMPAGEVLTIGARQRPDVIADAYESELGRGSSRTEALIRKMGMAY